MTDPAAPSAPAAPAAPSPAPAAPAAPAAASPPMPVPPASVTDRTPSLSTPAAPTPAPNADPAAPAAPTPPPDTNVTPTPPAGDFKVPDEYKDKPWAAKIKSLDDLYKQVDTLDALKGKKTIAPDLATATPEEREQFYAQLRPKDASEYQFPDTGIPMPPEYKTAVTDMFMKNGISATQANEIIKSYQEMGNAATAKMFDPAEFETTLKTAFGDDWKGVTANVRNTIKGMMTPEDQKMLDNIPRMHPR